MKKLLFMLLAVILSLTQMVAQTVPVTVGTATATTQSLPFYNNYDYSHSQMLFLAEELMPGQIDSISFYYDYATPKTINNSKIYLGSTNRTRMSKGNFMSADSLTLVYDGSITLSQGWVTIPLATSFSYNGSDNLVLAFTNGHGSWSATSGATFRQTPTADSMSVLNYADGTPVTVNNAGTVGYYNYAYAYRANVIFHTAPPEGFCYPPANLAVSNVTSNGADITWESEESSTTFAVEYKLATEEDWTLASNNISNNTYSLSGLTTYSAYDVKVYAVCTDGDSPIRRISFMTTPDASLCLSLPYEQNFDEMTEEELAKWYFQNSGTNAWHIGTAVNNTRGDDGELTENGGALYISNDNGVTNTYTGTSIAYAYAFVNFEADNNYGIQFDWKGMGEQSYDYIRTYLLPIDYELSTNTLPPPNHAISGILNRSGTWQSRGIEIADSLVGNTWKLVFAWRNDSSNDIPPAGAIDNLIIRTVSCSSIDSVLVSITDETGSVTASFAVHDQNEGAQYLVEYRIAGTEEWSSVTSASPVEVSDLLHSNIYEYRITAVCNGSNNSVVSAMKTFTTPCANISDFPYEQSFEQEFYPTDGVIGNKEAPHCWYNFNGGSDYYYFYRSTSTPISGAASLYYAGATYSSATYSYDWFISPVFDLTGNERLNFKLKASSTSTYYPDLVLNIYALDVSETDISVRTDTSRFTLVQTINHDWSTTNVRDYEISLGAYSAATRFAFVVNGVCRPFYLDDVKVSEMPACPDVYQVSAFAMSSTSASVSFDTSNGTEAGWTIAYGTVEEGTTFDPETATSTTVTGADQVPVIISGLTTGQTYWFAVKQSCEGGAYSVPVSCYIPVTNALPYEQNFDDAATATEWTFIKRPETATAAWVIGTAVNNTTDENGDPTEGGAMYVSTDGGTNTLYNANVTSRLYAVALIEMDASPGYNLSFDWQAGGDLYYSGDGSYDYLNVFLVPFGTEIPLSTYDNTLDNYAITDQLYLSNGQWQSVNMSLPGIYNGVYQLIFRWANDGSSTTDNTGAIIDNIKLVTLECGAVSSVSATIQEYAEDAENVPISVTIDDNNTNVSYILRYRTSFSAPWTEVGDLTAADFPYTFNADFMTTYQIQVAVVCSSDTTEFVSAANLTTPCASFSVPWSENFEINPLESTCWTRGTGQLPASGTFQTSSLTTGYAWYHNTSALVGGTTSGRLYINLYGSNRRDWVITPSINLGDGTATYQLAFDVAVRAFSADAVPQPAPDDRFAVLVSTDNGVSWNTANAIIFADGDADTLHNFSDLTNSFTRVTFKLVDEEEAPLSGAVKFAFYGESTINNGDNNLYIDNLEVSEWSACQAPYNVEVSNITDSSANVSFAAVDATASFEYVLVEGADTDVATGTAVAVTDGLTVALSELSHATTYNVAVRTICGEGVYSPWSIPVTFRTLAGPETIPYSTDFEDNADNATWSFASNSTNAWAIGTATFAGDEESGTSAYISNDNGVSYAATQTSSVTRAYIFKDFDFGEDATAVYNLDFDYKIMGRVVGNDAYCGLLVYVLNPQPLSTTTFPTEEREALLVGESDWTHEKLELTGYTGVKRLAFLTWGYTATSELSVPAAIDNVSLQVAACVSPQEVAVSNAMTTSVEVSWTGTSDSYIISYRALTDTEVTDVQATSSPFTLTDLNPATQYILAVRGVCGNDSSVYSETVRFRTSCFDGAVDEFPYLEDFENGLACWEVVNISGANTWTQSNGNNLTPTLTPMADGGQYFAETHGSSNRGNISRLISPVFDLTSLPVPVLSFYHTQRDWSGDIDKLKVYYRTSETEEWTQIAYYTEAIPAWRQDTIILPNPSATYQIAFEVNYDYGRGVTLDNVSIYEGTGEAPEPCDAPTALAVNNITQTSAEVSWNGTATGYEVRLNGGTPESVTATSKTFTGLTAGTAYTVEVRAVCESSQSAWVSTSFTTTEAQVDPCDAPTALTASNITQTSAEVSWNGTASSYEVRLNSGTPETVTATSKTLTGLTAGTAYTVEVRAVCENSQSPWVSTSFTTQNESGITAPTVNTLAASNITHDGASLNGTIMAGSEAITAQGFMYKASSAADWTTVAATGENITATLSNLTAETAYEYKAFATTASGTVEGQIMSFTTLEAPVVVTPPTVETLAASNITDNGATLNGTITAGSEEITAQGFMYKASSAADWTTVAATGENITATLSNLTAETAYEYKAFATTASGTVEGQIMSFTTLATSGLADAESGAIKAMIYPNPAKDKATLSLTGLTANAKIIVSDLQGRIIQTEDLQAGTETYELNTSNYASGVYYIRILCGNNVNTQKLIVE